MGEVEVVLDGKEVGVAGCCSTLIENEGEWCYVYEMC